MSSTVIEIPLSDVEDVALIFKKHTGIDLENIPEKYGDTIQKARKNLLDHLYIQAVYAYFDVEALEENGVAIAGGHWLEGTMAPRFLKEAKRGICMVASLAGFDKLANETEELMEDYFLDVWGSAYIEGSQTYFKNYVKQNLEKGEHLTHLWSPGQHNFELTNQRTLFSILHPEQIGVTLEKSCKMTPIKTVSSVLGILKEGVENDFLPCDFCPHGKTCPASKRGCGNY